MLQLILSLALPTPTPAGLATPGAVPNDDSERKVKPLKIKKASIANFSTPSPMLQRESREWKPSSQFFKPLNAGTAHFILEP